MRKPKRDLAVEAHQREMHAKSRCDACQGGEHSYCTKTSNGKVCCCGYS